MAARYIVGKLPRGSAVTLMPLSRTLLVAPLLVAVLGGPFAAEVQAATPAPVAGTGAVGSEIQQSLPPSSTQAGVVTIESDRQQADNATGIVTATGNVRIVYPDRQVVATARQAQYFTREARIVLSGDVQVLQEAGHRLLAEQVVYDVSNERVDARPFPGAQVVSIVRMRRSPGASAPTSTAPVPAPKVLPAP